MTPEDIAVLKAMFEDREGAVEVIRKIFYPELTADNPIFGNHDMYTETLQLDGLGEREQVIEVKSHLKLVRHIEGRLSIIKQLIGEKGETPEETLARIQKDSAR